MREWIIKGLNRCPSCKSCDIYRRVRIFQRVRIFERVRIFKIEKERRKANYNFIEEVVKRYRCHICKYEFDNPIIE